MTINDNLRKGGSGALVGVLLISALPVVAAPDKPPDPRLGTAPAMSAWTITYQYAKPDPYLTPPDPSQAALYARMHKNFPRLIQINVTKAGNNRKEVYSLNDQEQSIRWIMGNLLLWLNPTRKTSAIWNAKMPDAIQFTHDFDSLDWVNTADYQGHQTFQQVDCCTYHAANTPLGEQTAYINAKTGLPVATVAGTVTVSYSFSASQDPVTMPPEVTAKFNDYLSFNPDPNK